MDACTSPCQACQSLQPQYDHGLIIAGASAAFHTTTPVVPDRSPAATMPRSQSRRYDGRPRLQFRLIAKRPGDHVRAVAFASDGNTPPSDAPRQSPLKRFPALVSHRSVKRRGFGFDQRC